MEEQVLEQRKKMMEELLRDPSYVPMKLKELALLLNIPKDQRKDLKDVMDALVSEGKAGISKKGKYGKPETFALTGIFCGHPKGFGFVTIEGMEKDIFIPADKTESALHGDKVRSSSKKRKTDAGQKELSSVSWSVRIRKSSDCIRRAKISVL